MPGEFPSLSTDQVAAFVELSRQGSFAAAGGDVASQPARFAQPAAGFGETARHHAVSQTSRNAPQHAADSRRQAIPASCASLSAAFARTVRIVSNIGRAAQVRVAASQYLTLYVLVDAIRRFHAAKPDTRIRLQTRTEQEIEESLRQDPELNMGIAAPLESTPDLDYHHLFSMPWSLVTRPNHPLLRHRRLDLNALAAEPLILFERRFDGPATRRRGVPPCGCFSAQSRWKPQAPKSACEWSKPGWDWPSCRFCPAAAVTRGCRVGVRSLGKRIRPIDSGILFREVKRFRPRRRISSNSSSGVVGSKSHPHKVGTAHGSP